MNKIVIDYGDELSIETGRAKHIKELVDAGVEKDVAESKVNQIIEKELKKAEESLNKSRLTMNDLDEKIAESLDKKLQGLSKTDKRFMIFNEETEEKNKDASLDENERAANFLKGVAKMRENPFAANKFIASSRTGIPVNKLTPDAIEKALAPQSEGTDADGGYLVPEQLERSIFAIIEERGIAQREAAVIQVNTNSVKMNSRNAVLAASLVAEAAAVPDDKATFSQVVHTILKYGLTVAASSELIADNISLLPQELARQAGEAFAKWEDDQFFQSLSGLDSTSFSGIFSSPTENVMGSGDVTFAAVDYADILACIGGATDGEARGSKWMMHRSVWYSDILSLVDATNHPIAQEGANGMVLLGYPVITSDSIVSADAVSTNFIAFGNPKVVSFAQRSGIQVKVSDQGTVDGASLFETDQIGYRFLKRGSIENLKSAAIHTIKTAAS